MHIVLTGGNGFIGRMLLKRMKDHPVLGDPDHRITLIGRRFETEIDDPRIRTVIGNLTDPDIVAQAFEPAPDVVIHLAALGSKDSESDFDLGMQVNLHGTLGLLDALRHRGIRARFVFSSSIAVYGHPLPDPVTDDTPAVPGISYGAEKLATEVLLRDYTRRGWVEGVALRLCGILARPEMRATAGSVFLSDFLRRPAEGKPFVSPVSPKARFWAMSWPTCVENIMHAATMERGVEGEAATYMLPALHVGVGEMLDALARQYGEQVRDLITFEPNPEVERIFGMYPPLALTAAAQAGFRGDATADDLVRQSLEGIVPPVQ